MLPTLPWGGEGLPCHHSTRSHLYAKGSHQARKLAMSVPQLQSNPAVPCRAAAPSRGLTCAHRGAGVAGRGRVLLTREVRERCYLFGTDQDSAVEEAQELRGRLYLPAEARMLRGLRGGRRARVSRQKHGARRDPARARARARGAMGVPGQRAASHGGASRWPAAPRPPATSRLRLPEPLPSAGQHRLPSKGEGAEKWGGARSPGKDPRSFPERKSPLPPRGRKRGGPKGKCSLRAPGGCGGRPLASCPPRRAPPTAHQGPRNLGAFHAWVPAQETARHRWPGPRWPGASLALAAGGARPVPVTHFGASPAR